MIFKAFFNKKKKLEKKQIVFSIGILTYHKINFTKILALLGTHHHTKLNKQKKKK